MFTIYQITNVKNGKFYIGLTKKAIVQRLKAHYIRARDSNTYFHRSLLKYDKNDWTIESLEAFSSLDDAMQAESYFITLSRSYQKNVGYNITKGGEHPGIGADRPKKPQSKESIEKIKLTKRKVYGVSIIRSDGEIYQSVSEASEMTGVSASSIHDVMSGRYKTSGGFAWKRFKLGDEISPWTPQAKKSLKGIRSDKIPANAKKILRSDGVLFNTISEASLRTPISKRCIINSCKSNSVYKGYSFKYTESL